MLLVARQGLSSKNLAIRKPKDERNLFNIDRHRQICSRKRLRKTRTTSIATPQGANSLCVHCITVCSQHRTMSLVGQPEYDNNYGHVSTVYRYHKQTTRKQDKAPDR